MSADSERITINEQVKECVESISKVGRLSGHNIAEYKYRVHGVEVLNDIVSLQLIAAPGLSMDDTYCIAIDRSAMIFEVLFAEDKFFDWDEIQIFWHYPVVDLKGQVELNNILRIHLSRETSSTINWENFDNVNLADVADYYWRSI